LSSKEKIERYLNKNGLLESRGDQMKEYDLNDIKEEFGDTIIKIDNLKLIIKDRTAKEWDEVSSIPDPVVQLAMWADIDPKLLENISMKKIAAALKIIARGIIDSQEAVVEAKSQTIKRTIPSGKKKTH